VTRFGVNRIPIAVEDHMLIFHLGEFAVRNIDQIEFSLSPFQSLTIPDDKKAVIMSIAESQILQEGAMFDDVVIGKGLGVNVLL
jgi:hypothetical protein